MSSTGSLGLFLFFICLLVFGAQLQAQGTRAIVIKAKKPALATPMNYTGHHALLIGVSDYNRSSGWADLNSVPGELDALQTVLTESGFQVTRVNNPNKRQLEAAFGEFIDAYGYKPDNRLFFFYSGHGHSMKVGSKTRGFLVPADAPNPKHQGEFMRRTLQMTRILSWSKEMTAKHALFLFDSCFSGSVLSSRAFPKEPPHITKLTALPVRQYLTAGSEKETVPAQSTFAKFVVRGLKGEADRNKDKYILGTELGLYIKEKLAYYEAGTTPQIGKIRDADLDRGEFVIRVPKQSISVPVTPIKPQVIQVPTVTAPSVDLNTQVDQILAQLASFDKQKQQALDIGYLATSSKVKKIDSARTEYLSSHKAFLKSRLNLVKAEYALLSKEMRPDALPMKRLKLRLDQLNRIFAPAASGGKVGAFVTNSIGMKLMYIPAGEFLMGSPASEDKRDDDETQHRVRLTKSFYMCSTEVTQGQWQKVMGTTPWRGEKYVKEGADYPATYVSWDDAVAFCKKLSQKEGKTYTLPTEAEWEYVCRAGSPTAYTFGDDPSSLGRYAWYDENAWDVGNKYSHPVGGKTANAWGLYDMHGNALEWCSDWYGDYPSGTVTDPKGPASASRRVFRGGCWNIYVTSCRSADRGWNTPDNRSSSLGFRVLLRSQ